MDLSRRKFISTTAATAASITIIPSYTLGGVLGYKAPSDKLNIACIGIGGKGKANLAAVESENIIALCDVDWDYAGKVFEKYPNARRYWDFRKMFDEMSDDIDAVIVATPDHTHAIIAATAITLGIHVYCQKPLTHSVYESRLLTQLANKYKVATQMGNQGNSSPEARTIREWIANGEIGDVLEAHAWTNRPLWPQGLSRPAEEMKVPDKLNWDLFIGPAPMRPYHRAYHPWDWRGWWDFGTGALGDMACHTMDAAFWGLDLLYPTSVIAEASGISPETAPKKSIVTYEFPARGDMPPLTLKWYDGGNKPPRPKELGAGRKFSSRCGFLIVGSKGTIYDTTDYSKSPRIIPEAKMREAMATKPKKTIPRVPGGQPQGEWLRAIKGGPKPAGNFDYSGPFTETVVMGNLAVRIAGTKVEWDGPNMKCTNSKKADALVRKEYRVF